MKNVTVLEPITLRGGLVKLTEAQARQRAHCLKAQDEGEGVYLVIGPTQFKVGERFGIEDISKVNHAALSMDKPEGEKDKADPPGAAVRKNSTKTAK